MFTSLVVVIYDLGMTSRPSKLTPEVKRRLVDAVKAGNHITRACEFAGIGKATYYRWKAKADTSKSGEYFELMRELEEAESQAQIRMVAQWQSQIPNDWRAAREFLARRFPDEGSSLEKREISGDVDKPVRVYTLDIGGELADDESENS